MGHRDRGKSLIPWAIGTLLVCSVGLASADELWLADLAIELNGTKDARAQTVTYHTYQMTLQNGGDDDGRVMRLLLSFSSPPTGLKILTVTPAHGVTYSTASYARLLTDVGT